MGLVGLQASCRSRAHTLDMGYLDPKITSPAPAFSPKTVEGTIRLGEPLQGRGDNKPACSPEVTCTDHTDCNRSLVSAEVNRKPVPPP